MPIGAVDLSIIFSSFFFFFCSIQREGKRKKTEKGRIRVWVLPPLAWIRAERSESEEYVGRSEEFGKLASCAADATRELTTHASYRALLSDIYRVIYHRTPFPVCKPYHRRTSGKPANILLNEASREEEGGLSVPGESQDVESTCSFTRSRESLICTRRITFLLELPWLKRNFFLGDIAQSFCRFNRNLKETFFPFL